MTQCTAIASTTGRRCHHRATHLCVWPLSHDTSRPSCGQHTQTYFASARARVVKLPAHWDIGLLAARVRRGLCALDETGDRCITHDEPATIGHHLAHSRSGGYATND